MSSFDRPTQSSLAKQRDKADTSGSKKPPFIPAGTTSSHNVFAQQSAQQRREQLSSGTKTHSSPKSQRSASTSRSTHTSTSTTTSHESPRSRSSSTSSVNSTSSSTSLSPMPPPPPPPPSPRSSRPQLSYFKDASEAEATYHSGRTGFDPTHHSSSSSKMGPDMGTASERSNYEKGTGTQKSTGHHKMPEKYLRQSTTFMSSGELDEARKVALGDHEQSVRNALRAHKTGTKKFDNAPPNIQQKMLDSDTKKAMGHLNDASTEQLLVTMPSNIQWGERPEDREAGWDPGNSGVDSVFGGDGSTTPRTRRVHSFMTDPKNRNPQTSDKSEFIDTLKKMSGDTKTELGSSTNTFVQGTTSRDHRTTTSHKSTASSSSSSSTTSGGTSGGTTGGTTGSSSGTG